MAKHKLTQTQQEALIAWLCEGLRDAQIIEKLQTGFGITVSQQNSNHYRDQYADKIAETGKETYAPRFTEKYLWGRGPRGRFTRGGRR